VDLTRNLFALNNRNAKSPPNFKLPTLDSYDGRTDPTTHLRKYMQHMEVLKATEEIVALCFLRYLVDLTMMWFRQLENESINTWVDLIEKFMNQFRVHVTRLRM